MPFPKQDPKPFTQAGIESITAGQKGCYGIFKPKTWIYVGKADDIRARLLQQLGESGTCIKRHSPTNWVAVVTADNDNKEKQLIVELTPLCNQKVG